MAEHRASPRQPHEGRQIRPQRTAALELPQDGVIVFEQPQMDEAGKVVALRCRKVPALGHGPYDLPEQIEMVKKQALIIHEGREPTDYQ